MELAWEENNNFFPIRGNMTDPRNGHFIHRKTVCVYSAFFWSTTSQEGQQDQPKKLSFKD